jgi:hypothetical protein
MIYVVERYLPGLFPADLARALDRLASVTVNLRREGTMVHYLGSTIVPQDEACFCRFDAPSKRAVIEANRRAKLRFDRIVEAVDVGIEADPPSLASPNQRTRKESS